MKIRYLSRIFLLFICLLTFASATVAQEKPKALKFDEFEDSSKRPTYVYDEITLPQRTERFIKQLKKERAVRAYIIYYQARITEYFSEYEISNRTGKIKNEIRFKSNLESEDVVIIEGGYREERTIEFWIAPKNAEPPEPTPTLDKSETFVCPDLNVYGNVPYGETETVNFSVSPYNFEKINDYSLMWKVSAGEIVGGQGTEKITVKLKDSGLKRITAFVEVGGLPYPCRKISSATAEFRGKLNLIDSFGPIATGEMRARLDSFGVDLQNNPTAKGFIIVYGNRSGANRDAERRIMVINNHFRFRNFDVSRIKVMRGGFREHLSSELWLSFDDAAQPIPTPTVDKKFVEIPKQIRKPNRSKQ